MLKFKTLANIGDTIRSYDFYGNKEVYIEGVVVDKGWIKHPTTGHELYKGYTVRCTKDTMDAGYYSNRLHDTVYVPFETTLEYDERVELVDYDNRAEEELAISLMKEFA